MLPIVVILCLASQVLGGPVYNKVHEEGHGEGHEDSSAASNHIAKYGHEDGAYRETHDTKDSGYGYAKYDQSGHGGHGGYRNYGYPSYGYPSHRYPYGHYRGVAHHGYNVAPAHHGYNNAPANHGYKAAPAHHGDYGHKNYDFSYNKGSGTKHEDVYSKDYAFHKDDARKTGSHAAASNYYYKRPPYYAGARNVHKRSVGYGYPHYGYGHGYNNGYHGNLYNGYGSPYYRYGNYGYH